MQYHLAQMQTYKKIRDIHNSWITAVAMVTDLVPSVVLMLPQYFGGAGGQG